MRNVALSRCCTVALVVLARVSAVQAAEWIHETVPIGNTFVNLAFDPGSGHPWACGNTGIFERVGPDDWQQHPCDGYSGWMSSIAFAGPGAPAVSASEPQGNLEYSHIEGPVCSTETVWAGRSGCTSLAFKSDGNPAISHCWMDRDGGGLHGVEYCEFDGSGWSCWSAPGACGNTSLALDEDDRPWIGFTYPTPVSFRVDHWTGSAWQSWIVQANAGNGNEQSLALDPDGLPVVAWLTYGGEGYLSRYDGSQWVMEPVPFASNAWDWAALAFNPLTGRAVVAYRGLDGNLWLARETETAWTQEFVGAGGATVYISAAFDSCGRLGLLKGDSFFYEYCEVVPPGGWTLHFPDPTSGDGRSVAIAVDGDGEPRVAYTVAYLASPELRYIAWDNGAWGDHRVVDGNAGYLFPVSMAYDTARSTAHIAYGRSQLDYEGDVYSATFVDPDGPVVTSEVGPGPEDKFPGVALTTSGAPVIAYHHRINYPSVPPNRELYFWGGPCPGATPFPNLGGWTPGLDLDSMGRVHVCFHHGYQSAPEALAYTYCDGGTWAPLQYPGGKGYPCDLALDSNDRPHIVADGNYRFWTGGGWSPPVGLGNNGECAIVIDASDNSHIVCGANSGLVYSRIDPLGVVRVQETVVSQPVEDCDIALGGQSGTVPIIAYLDDSRALVVAWRVGVRPRITAWRSVREHGIGAVPLAIELDPLATGTAVTCEPRREGVQRIEVGFDVDVSGLISGTVVAEDLTHGGTIPATGQYTINAGTTLVVEFKFPNPAWPGSPPEFFGLADQACYRIDLAANIANPCGDMNCEFRVLAGDLNGLTLPYGDGKTDLTDMAHVKSMAVAGAPLLDPWGQPIPENIRFDVNTDGVISLTDMALVKSLIGHAAACPVTPPPPGMVLIPAGEFQMGDTFNEGHPDEQPVHAVYVDAFYMDRYEVTNHQYADALNWAYAQGNLITVTDGVVYKYNSGTSYPYCDTTTSNSDSRITWNGTTFGVTSGKENHPMVKVSWYGSVAYANWRSAMQGKPLCYDLSTWNCNWGSGYRLPTEAEWERAARGGASGHRFPWSDSDYIQHARANYRSYAEYSYDTSPTRGYHPDFDNPPYPYTSPVGYFAANGYGLYDMAGNVWELCNDWYSSSYYSSSPYNNPHGPTSGTYRVDRSGGWGDTALNCRAASRDHDSYPGVRGENLGFRLALDSE